MLTSDGKPAPPQLLTCCSDAAPAGVTRRRAASASAPAVARATVLRPVAGMVMGMVMPKVMRCPGKDLSAGCPGCETFWDTSGADAVPGDACQGLGRSNFSDPRAQLLYNYLNRCLRR